MQRRSVIVGAKRTPIGAFQGQLSSLSSSDLGSIVIKQILTDTNIQTHQIDALKCNFVIPKTAMIFVGNNKQEE